MGNGNGRTRGGGGDGSGKVLEQGSHTSCPTLPVGVFVCVCVYVCMFVGFLTVLAFVGARDQTQVLELLGSLSITEPHPPRPPKCVFL